MASTSQCQARRRMPWKKLWPPRVDCYIKLDAETSDDVKKLLGQLQISAFTRVISGYVAAHGVLMSKTLMPSAG